MEQQELNSCYLTDMKRTVQHTVPDVDLCEMISGHATTESYDWIPFHTDTSMNIDNNDLSHVIFDVTDAASRHPEGSQRDDAININNCNSRPQCSNKSGVSSNRFDLFGFRDEVAPSVVNLSNYQLSEAETSLLSKGLNFCPTPGEPDMLTMCKDLDRFHRQLRLKAFFGKEKVKKAFNRRW